VLESKAPLLEALLIEERLEMVLGNYEDFESEVLRLSLQHSIYMESAVPDLDVHRRILARRTLNLLSVCRMYRDQLRCSLRRLFGRGSTISRAVEEQIGIYERLAPGYRLMECVRDVLQHSVMPIRSIRAAHQVTDLKEDWGIASTVTPELDRRALQEGRDFRARLGDELDSLPERFDLKPHIRHYVGYIAELNRFVRDKLEPHVREWEGAAEAVTERYRTELGLSPQELPKQLRVLALAAGEPPSGQLSGQHVPLDLIVSRRELVTRMAHAVNLWKRYVTDLPAELLLPPRSREGRLAAG
ncbi:MAG: hypothetical protein AB7V19_00960, partial [Candidatus Bipolaricaulia bacterium]